MDVRAARPDEETAARAVAAAAFETQRTVYRPSAEAIAHASQLALERLVALAGGELVGTARWGIEGDRLRVIGLAVLPGHRRRGIARALVEELAGIARDSGCSALALYTVVQTGNVAVFERLGFAVVHEEPATDAISPTGQPLTEAYLERVVEPGPTR